MGRRVDLSADARRASGVMGGTFDPIHHGHLVAASEVAARFDLDEVVFVPTGQPWQKADREVTAAEDRYLMAALRKRTCGDADAGFRPCQRAKTIVNIEDFHAL